MAFNFGSYNSKSSSNAASLLGLSNDNNVVDKNSFEASCSEGEHIIAFNLRPAKHWESSGGSMKNTIGKRNNTYLTVTAGSVMTTEQDQPFLKGKLLVSAFLYKDGRYVEPPAYAQVQSGQWELHPKSSCTGLSSIVYGIWLKDTKEALGIFANEIEQIVGKHNYFNSIPSLIEGLEGCVLTDDYTAFESNGVTDEESATKAIESLNADYKVLKREMPTLQERFDFLNQKCEEEEAKLKDKFYWRGMVEKIQESVNLIGLANEDIMDAFHELKEPKCAGLLLKCKVKVVYDYLNTFEIKVICLKSVIEKGNLGSAVTGTVVTQKASTSFMKETENHLNELSKMSQAEDMLQRLSAWSNTSTVGNKKQQSLKDYQQSTQGGTAETKKKNDEKVTKRAKAKATELETLLAQLKANDPQNAEIVSLESQLAAIRKRIAEMSEKANQELAASSLEETTEETLPAFTGNETGEEVI